jgi:hypothetical protein
MLLCVRDEKRRRLPDVARVRSINSALDSAVILLHSPVCVGEKRRRLPDVARVRRINSVLDSAVILSLAPLCVCVCVCVCVETKREFFSDSTTVRSINSVPDSAMFLPHTSYSGCPTRNRFEWESRCQWSRAPTIDVMKHSVLLSHGYSFRVATFVYRSLNSNPWVNSCRTKILASLSICLSVTVHFRLFLNYACHAIHKDVVILVATKLNSCNVKFQLSGTSHIEYWELSNVSANTAVAILTVYMIMNSYYLISYSVSQQIT